METQANPEASGNPEPQRSGAGSPQAKAGGKSAESSDEREVIWIQDSDSLEAFCRQARLERVVAVDTEFHREKTYYARLGLVQLATFQQIACVDPLAPGIDLEPLDRLMNDAQVLKIFHAARQDLEIFVERNKQVPGPFFDTQVAAALLGLGEQIGYGPLVQKVCNTALAKTQVRTDWMHRPLDPEVIRYAADDVRYLAELYRRLHSELLRRGRREWLEEEQRFLSDPATYRVDRTSAWERVKGTDKLKGASCAIAQSVAAWREQTAQELDRPRRRILPDEIVMDLARQRPRSMQVLERMRGLDPGLRKKFGKRLLELVAEAEAQPKEQWPRAAPRGLPADVDDGLVQALSVVLQLRARQGDISAAMLASKSELAALAAGDRDLPVLQGWRLELVGEALLSFLGGKTALRVSHKHLVLDDTGA
jgi:ribonuclease D